MSRKLVVRVRLRFVSRKEPEHPTTYRPGSYSLFSRVRRLLGPVILASTVSANPKDPRMLAGFRPESLI